MIRDIEKLYPKITSDKGGMKFNFNYGSKHFTMRFSGKPMIILEKYFIKFGGTKSRFLEIWKTMNDSSININITDIEKDIIKKSIDRLNELTEVLELCSTDNKSPFVIYVNDFNAYK